MTKPQLSWKIIYAAAQNAANKNMRLKDRKTWGSEEYEIATKTVQDLYKKMVHRYE